MAKCVVELHRYQHAGASSRTIANRPDETAEDPSALVVSAEIEATASFQTVINSGTTVVGYVVAAAFEEALWLHLGSSPSTATSLCLLPNTQRRFLVTAGQTVSVRTVAS